MNQIKEIIDNKDGTQTMVLNQIESKSYIAKTEFGIQECSKCEYKLRCEECVYNGKDIAALIDFEKQQKEKDTIREILNYIEKTFEWSQIDEIYDMHEWIKEHFGVDLGE